MDYTIVLGAVEQPENVRDYITRSCKNSASLQGLFLSILSKTQFRKNAPKKHGQFYACCPLSIVVHLAGNPFKTKFSYMSVMNNQFKNVKTPFEHAKIPSENPKNSNLTLQKFNLKMLKLKKPRKYLRKFSWIHAKSPGLL